MPGDQLLGLRAEREVGKDNIALFAEEESGEGEVKACGEELAPAERGAERRCLYQSLRP